MRLKSVTILALMLLPMVSQAQRQQYQQVNDISYTASDFASPNGTLLSLLDRLFYSNLHTDWSMKVGAAVSIARRGGATATMDGKS